ncbi:MAG: thiol:disulfide interchange protein DsbA/DsbL [Hydrogenophilaceae bacterium]|nr:thiol:disulfide interchange protein DsbA/DsbL [Hydrogenophilaceae bacterium]
MPRVRQIASLLFALCLIGTPLAARAIDEGVDYLALSAPRPTETKGKIEVLEFFWYACPHCYRLEPELNAWTKKLPKDVVLRRIPAILNADWEPLTRAYYALESLGLTDKLHAKVFEAIHVDGINLNKPEVFFDWAAKQGADKAKLAQEYNSFSVNTKVMRSRQVAQEYKLSGVPAFVVNGKYVTSAYMTGSNPALFEALNQLIKKEQDGRKRASK